MIGLEASRDTSAFEVAAVLGRDGRLTDQCALEAMSRMDAHGFVILTNLLSDDEANAGLHLIRQTIDDPDRSRCAFASETDNRYLRRDFCSLPASAPVLGFAATISQRLEQVLLNYCARPHRLLEVSTLTSYIGSSHQYIHRDASGVISLFAAVEDVSDEQGGTVFVPGTHPDGNATRRLGEDAERMMELFRTRTNSQILRHNLRKLWNMRKSSQAPLAPGEFRDRVFSSKWDEHQPNLMRFALGKNPQFCIRNLGPRTLWSLYRRRAHLRQSFRVVKTAPRKGTVILYQSDLLHAGPDNRSPEARRLFSMSFARGSIETKAWHTGYSPHPTLAANPMTLGDLLDASPASPASPAREPRMTSPVG